MADEVQGGAVVNTSPRPRMLVLGFPGEEDLVAELLQICPTSRHIDSLRQVRQAEWDILVTDEKLEEKKQYSGIIRAASHLCIVYRSPKANHYHTIEYAPGWKCAISSVPGVVSQEIRRMRNLPERIAILVHEKLEPVVMQRTTHRVFEWRKLPNSAGSLQPPEIVPFISTADNHPLAGKYARSDSSEAWLLPKDVPDLPSWVRAALAEWNGLAPERFPGVPDWSTREAWLTKEELRITSEIQKVESERLEYLNRAREIEADLQARLAEARESADRYERALLTAQSDELKEVVIQTLQEIGFTVLDADGSAASDDHLEDLHIMNPDSPGWVALGEVKGYSRGARTEGLTQFLRFNMRYTSKTGRSPDACWYIVNQFIRRDPSTRQRALHGKDEDVKAFGAANGLVIDTVQLFHLLRQVRDEVLTPRDARELLRNSSGRFIIQ
ncbi:hypothetical protein [Streptomyces antibioticus]